MRTLVADAVARRSYPPQATSATATWGKPYASASSTPSSNWIWWELPLRGDLWLVSPRFLPTSVASGSMPHRALSWCLMCDRWWLWCVCARRWKRQGAVLPVCLVKTSPGSPWLATRALPRHAIQACAWASGECVASPSPTFSSLATVTGQLALFSCAKLTDLILWSYLLMQACCIGFSYLLLCLICDKHAIFISLSENFSDRGVKLNFAACSV
jgi:hypothetical protein